MATLYVTEPGAVIRISGGLWRVEKGKRTLAELPGATVSQIVIMGKAGLTTPALHHALASETEVFFLSRSGRYLGHLQPAPGRNLPLRQRQFSAAADDSLCLALSRNLVAAKLANARLLLLRLGRRGLLSSSLEEEIACLAAATHQAQEADSAASLRGIEGAAARQYFGALRQALAGTFPSPRRSRRPPPDPANVLFSLAYSLLLTQVLSAIMLCGLDPYQGYYHADRYGRPALALDLMEPFRPALADRLVLSCANLRVVRPDDFQSLPEAGLVSLAPDGLRRFCSHFTRGLQAEFAHPLTGQRMTYRRCLELHTRLLAKFLLGEIPDYPAFTQEK